jgi:V/A-type H+-transporting ATPase subunit B
MNQGQYENRDIETTLNLAWEVISTLPDSELTNISDKSREVYSNVIQKRSVKV